MSGWRVFEWAAGSVQGRDHRLAGSASQDAWWLMHGERALIAVVADGCGSGRHSEVGARLGCRLLAESLRRLLDAGANLADRALWRAARADVLAELRALADAMGGELGPLVSDHFLFTLVGVAVTAELTAVFSIGDGLVAINGALRELGPYPGNRPPYLGYGLLPETDEMLSALEVHALRPTDEIASVLIATDGATELSTDELLELKRDDRLFCNRDALRRRLYQINRDVVRPDWIRQRLSRSPGRLRDDTTIIVARRRGSS